MWSVSQMDAFLSPPNTLNSLIKTWHFLLHFQSKTKAFRACGTGNKGNFEVFYLAPKGSAEEAPQLPNTAWCSFSLAWTLHNISTGTAPLCLPAPGTSPHAPSPVTLHGCPPVGSQSLPGSVCATVTHTGTVSLLLALSSPQTCHLLLSPS